MNDPAARRGIDRITAFVGGGQMATALIGGLLRAGVSAPSIVVIEPDPPQQERLRESLGVRTMSGADNTLRQADVVVWAVKPQVLSRAAEDIRPLLAAPLHISIVAGVPIPALARMVGSERVIRVMPNTPALVGAGVTGMLAASQVKDSDRQVAEQLLGPTGYTFWVDSDERIDAVTAVSGSGPAYVFYFLETLQQAAEKLGFPEVQARELVLRTAAGALQQALSDHTPLATLRERVTSKGGTTQAALEVLTEHQFSAVVSQAVNGAYARAQELSRASAG